MDIIQVGLQKLKCKSRGDNVQVRRRWKKEFDLSWQMSILHTEICSHVNLEYTEVIYLGTIENEWLYIIKYLIHVTIIYESLQNYILLSTAPIHSYIRHSQEDNTNMDCKLGFKHLILKGTVACIMQQMYNQTFSLSLLKYMTRQYELLLLLTCSSTHTKLRWL